MTTTSCSACGLSLKEDTGAVRVPCTRCGGLARTFDVQISESVQFSDRIFNKYRSPGKKRFNVQIEEGASFYAKEGVWNQLYRRIDRSNNRYCERITDESGRVLRYVEEPLSDHRSISKGPPFSRG